MEGGYKITNVQHFSFKTEVCSECGLIKQLTEMYRNRITGKLWCIYCVANEKKKRNAICWEKTSEPDIKMKSKEKNLSQGGRDIKTYTNIIMASGGVNNTQKVEGTSRIDKLPRLLVVKNNSHKVTPKSKSKSKIPSKKKRKEVKTYRKGRIALCAHCHANVKLRAVKNFTHINISQKLARHYFCSKECKTAWIYALSNKKSKQS